MLKLLTLHIKTSNKTATPTTHKYMISVTVNNCSLTYEICHNHVSATFVWNIFMYVKYHYNSHKDKQKFLSN